MGITTFPSLWVRKSSLVEGVEDVMVVGAAEVFMRSIWNLRWAGVRVSAEKGVVRLQRVVNDCDVEYIL